METPEAQAGGLSELAAEIRDAAWDLALQVIEEGLRDDTIPSLARLGRLWQLGDVPTFIVELSHELVDPRGQRLRRGSPLAAGARQHAREREGLGFSPREIVTEFLVLRRVLWRFVAERARRLDQEEVLLAERRLNDTIDGLVTECVVAYFDRAMSDLAYQAQHDQLTDLLNHQELTRQLELEIERARRYEHGLSLVFVDLDRFKDVNDTLGHPEGDRVLRRVAELFRENARATDVAGRMGGDEFAVLLIEAEAEAAGRFLSRLTDRVDELVATGELPGIFGLSAGVAHFPTDGTSAEALFRTADERLYEAKRAR